MKKATLIEIYLIVCVGICLGGFAAIFLGKDVNWDLQNYHYYGAYALMTKRIGLDYAPGGIQTYINPLIYVPAYIMMNLLRPKEAGFLLGALQGLNFAVVYLIAKELLKSHKSKVAVSLSLLAAAIGFTAPIFISEIGTSFSDNLISLLVLFSVWLGITALNNSSSKNTEIWKISLSSLLLGSASGLKLTNAVYALAFLVAVIICVWPRDISKCFIAWALFCFVGFLLTSGYWSYILWQNFKNPIFPFYNAVFKSPYFPQINFEDHQFLPNSLVEAFLYPFYWLIGRPKAPEIGFRDGRFAIITVLLVIICGRYLLLVARAFQLKSLDFLRSRIHISKQWRFVLAFFVLAYVLWMWKFAIHRYAINLELLSGVIIVMLMQNLVQRKLFAIAVTTILGLGIILWTQPGDWGRKPWSDTGNWFGVDLPASMKSEDIMYLMLDRWNPNSFLIPMFPKSAVFVNLTKQMSSDTLFREKAIEAVKEHHGMLRTLTSEVHELDQKTIDELGLVIDSKDCISFNSQLRRFVSCRAFVGKK